MLIGKIIGTIPNECVEDAISIIRDRREKREQEKKEERKKDKIEENIKAKMERKEILGLLKDLIALQKK